MDRVGVYIDGFNLYFGICDKGWRRYLWLDLPTLARRLLQPGQQLVSVKYFTARVRADPGKIHRQSTYLQALEARGGLTIRYGRYQEKTKECRNCHSTWTEHEEKMTDVRLASELLRDAYKDTFDVAVIVSADADLQPPIEFIRLDLPSKRIVVVFPPERDSFHLRAIADDYFRIGRARLSKSQLPPVVNKHDGYPLKRPIEWH
jgi:uncharacterized LabA/DUF88 family protein